MRPAGEVTPLALALFDNEAPLCARARYARMRRGGPAWWLEQRASASSVLDGMFWAGLVVMWSSPSNLLSLASEVSEIVDSLGDDEYVSLRAAVSAAALTNGYRADRRKVPRVDVRGFSARAAALVAIAMRASASSVEYSSDQKGSEEFGSFLGESEERERVAATPAWKDSDQVLAWARVIASATPGRALSNLVAHHLFSAKLRMDAVREVLANPESYPRQVVAHAVKESQARYRPKALAEVSSEQDWVFR